MASLDTWKERDSWRAETALVSVPDRGVEARNTAGLGVEAERST